MPFGRFLDRYMTPADDDDDDEEEEEASARRRRRRTGYLAQHDLFAQIPALRADIVVPDYCYSCPPPPSLRSTTTNAPPAAREADDNNEENEENEENEGNDVPTPLLNAWFGPAHTISPLHTDPHHNILAQVVGSKYVRLYAPTQSQKLHPRDSSGAGGAGAGVGGVDMSNTSRCDVGDAMRAGGWKGWDAFEHHHRRRRRRRRSESCSESRSESCSDDDDDAGSDDTAALRARLASAFPGFLDAEYVDGILAPGECLYIPRGWWHYVRSLSPSFSVSFWWD
jgi:lysine-specific demethylase 8